MNRQQRRAAERARAKAASRQGQSGGRSAGATAAEGLLGQQRWPEAEQAARQALEQDGEDHLARATLRTALWRQGRHDEAMLEARRLVQERPDDPAAHEALGYMLLSQDRLPESAAAFERALALGPERSTAHSGLGNSLAAVGVLDDALEHHERAVELAPDAPAACNDLALTHYHMGDYAAAAYWFTRAAERVDGTSSLILWNRSLALLGVGDLERAWVDYEAGLAAGARRPVRNPAPPRWHGEDLSGRTLLIWGEQGLGDEVRFASCYREAIQMADDVIIETAPRLVSLLARSFSEATVRAETFDRRAGRETSSFEGVDVQSPAGALPRYLRPTLEAFPRRAAYLVADPAHREEFRQRLAALPSGLRVGICWRSGKLETSRLANYLTLDELSPVLRRQDLTFVNLQYGDVAHRERELEEVEALVGTHVHRWADVDYTDDLDAVAGLAAELDVVIGPGTFPTVLAGALGTPTCVLSPATPWTHGWEPRDPWFPAIHHLVRPWDGTWQPLVEQLATLLGDMAAGRAAPFERA